MFSIPPSFLPHLTKRIRIFRDTAYAPYCFEQRQENKREFDYTSLLLPLFPLKYAPKMNTKLVFNNVTVLIIN